MLDVGASGRGASGKNISFLEKFAKHLKNKYIIGTDISANSLSLAKKYHPDTQFFIADTKALPFGDEAFDLVVATGTIHHMPDPQEGMEEVIRIVKPGRYLYVSLYNRNGPYYHIYRACHVLRWMKRHGLERIVQYVLVPLYCVVYWVANIIFNMTVRTIPYREVSMDCHDNFLTPVGRKRHTAPHRGLGGEPQAGGADLEAGGAEGAGAAAEARSAVAQRRIVHPAEAAVSGPRLVVRLRGLEDARGGRAGRAMEARVQYRRSAFLHLGGT